jgi:PKD repeat protein
MIDVLVNPLPLPDFSWTDVCLGDPMSFTNLSDFDSLYISSIVNYSWDFGDGAGSSNQQNPSYTYASAGNFNVVLSITDNNGCQDSIVHQVRVFDNPTANFSAPDVCIGDPTQFTNLSNNSLLGSPIVSWSWDFGDGSGTSVLQNPSYQYAAVGNYNVTLTITDSFGCTDDTTIQVVVNPLPDASYTYAPTTGCHPLTVQFTHTGSPGVTHLWYDNGAFVSNQANPLLTLTNASPIIDANHVIMHVVEAGTFCTDTIIDTVIVFPKPSANFNFTPASTCAPDTLKVNNTTQVKGPANYLWSVSSSAVSISNPNDPAPVFTFPDNQSGTDSTYTVTVIASSVDGCLDTFSRTITIYSRPVVSFTIDSTTCGPASLTPVNNSIGNGLNYSWSSAPGGSFSNPTLAQPQLNLPVSLNDSVIYTVILVITDVNACTDEDSAQVILYPKPTAAFAASNYDSCGDFTVQFSNLSTPNNGLETINDMSFIWDLGNGQSSNLQDPSAIYTNSGVTDSLYIVELIAISPHNCTDTIVDTITVYPNPVAQYNRTLQADCAPFILDSTIISLIDFPDANDNYQWFADGVSIGSGMTFPGFAMNSGPDTVIISLVATNVHGCQPDTFELEFYTIEQPVAGFTLPINAGCHPLSISPVDTSVSANSYSWFIDGQLVSNLQNPTLTFRNNSFTQDSIQTVTLIVTAGTGCSDTVDQLVTVYPKPQADFDFNPSERTRFL